MKDGLTILFKAESSSRDQVYLQELEKLKLTCRIIPSISFKYRNQDKIQSCFQSHEEYSGLIFTSPRSVEAVVEAFEGNELVLNQIREKWGQLHIFSVGEATHQLVECKLGLNSAGKECGNAEKLASNINETVTDAKKPFLCPCGNLSTDTLTKSLANAGIHTESVIVYETIPHPELSENILRIFENGVPEYVIYFSPSSIEFTVKVFDDLNISLKDCKIVAIGLTTAAALESKRLSVHCVASKPNPTSLAEAIFQANKCSFKS